MAEKMDYDPMEGTSELFAALTRDVPLEQWEQYKEEIRLGNHIIDDSDDDSEYSDRSVSPVPDEIITNIELVEEDEEGEEKRIESDEDNDQILWGYDAADKYAQGLISFSELTNVLRDPTPRHAKKRRRLEEEKIDKEPEKDPEPESEPIENTAQTPKKKARRKKNLLPKGLASVMGYANQAYSAHQYELAIRICMELIKEAPQAYEPFQLLGVVYDEMGEERKAFQVT